MKRVTIVLVEASDEVCGKRERCASRIFVS